VVSSDVPSQRVTERHAEDSRQHLRFDFERVAE
jgi:hypothetical protein